MNKKLFKEIEVVNNPLNRKKNDWGLCDPYVFIFLYSDKGNFLIKGYKFEAINYIKQNFKRYFYNLVAFKDGKNRNYWKFCNEKILILEPNLHRKKFEITNFSTYSKKFKRLPKYWITEFDKLINI